MSARQIGIMKQTILSLAVLFCIQLAATAIDSVAIINKITECDQALRQGTISYQLVSQNIKINPKGTYTETVQWRYTADGKFHTISTGNPTAIGEHVYDGKDDFYLLTCEPKSVVFSSNIHIRNISGYYEFVPRPCFALGRGLFELQDIVVSADSRGVIHLSGIGHDDTSIEAILDAGHGYVATEIVRKDKYQVIGKWKLASPKQFGASPYIATAAEFSPMNRANKPMSIDQYQIDDAQFSTPSQASLQYNWHKPGLRIIDSRLGTQRVYKSEDLPPDTTPATLYEMTRKSQLIADAAAKKRGAVEAYKRKIFSRPLLLPIIVTGLVLAVILLILLNRCNKPHAE